MAAPQQPSGGQDNSAGILWGVAGIFAAIAFIWFAFKNVIVTSFLTLKLVEAKFLTFLGGSHFLDVQRRILLHLADPGNVKFQTLVAAGNSVGDWLRFPFVICLVILGFVVYFSNTTRVFKRVYTMQDLAKLEKHNWPQIVPVVDQDLIKTDIDKGPWAMAMTPIQFCKRYQLLEEVRPERREGMLRKDWDKIDVILKRGGANKVFALQLGHAFQGVDKLPPHVKALFAAFAARINADSKPAAELLLRLSGSSTQKLDMTGVEELLQKHVNTKEVQQIIKSHGYVLTVMASMLESARNDGVQASADFLWLKTVDRRLWYTLNTVGRQTPFAEVAGVFAHWIAEKEVGNKLMVPVIEEATNALEIALKEVVYRPES